MHITVIISFLYLKDGLDIYWLTKVGQDNKILYLFVPKIMKNILSVDNLN
jgi:hypothetical protein